MAAMTVDQLVSSIEGAPDANAEAASPLGVPPTETEDAGMDNQLEVQLIEEFRMAPPEEAAVALKELVKLFVRDAG
jgi:hypothetical protein